MSNTNDITLPLIGYSRWSDIKKLVPVSRETWRKMRKNGTAPQEILLSPRCVMYSNKEIHRFLADPTNYKAEETK